MTTAVPSSHSLTGNALGAAGALKEAPSEAGPALCQLLSSGFPEGRVWLHSALEPQCLPQGQSRAQTHTLGVSDPVNCHEIETVNLLDRRGFGEVSAKIKSLTHLHYLDQLLNLSNSKPITDSVSSSVK